MLGARRLRDDVIAYIALCPGLAGSLYQSAIRNLLLVELAPFGSACLYRALHLSCMLFLPRCAAQPVMRYPHAVPCWFLPSRLLTYVARRYLSSGHTC
jgi:hypothetical protein